MARVDWPTNCTRYLAYQRTISRLGGICLMQLYLCMPAMAEQSGDALPSSAFLEFLAEWEDENGEWQDPIEYHEMGLEFIDQREDQDDE
ncbi:MAG: hypothetical protein AB2598_05580 [Candidatus Thiodiazotropha sp.]